MQLASVPEPAVAEYFPATQPMQLSAEADEYFPATQSMQSVSASLPATATYFPAAQWMQLASVPEPAVAEYFPATHSTQSAGPPLPIVSTYFPAGQSMHESELPQSGVLTMPRPRSALWRISTQIQPFLNGLNQIPTFLIIPSESGRKFRVYSGIALISIVRLKSAVLTWADQDRIYRGFLDQNRTCGGFPLQSCIFPHSLSDAFSLYIRAIRWFAGICA